MGYQNPNANYYQSPGVPPTSAMNAGYQSGYGMGQSGGQYMQGQQQQQQYPMGSGGSGQVYSNPNYQYYIGNNPNK